MRNEVVSGFYDLVGAGAEHFLAARWYVRIGANGVVRWLIMPQGLLGSLGGMGLLMLHAAPLTV